MKFSFRICEVIFLNFVLVCHWLIFTPVYAVAFFGSWLDEVVDNRLKEVMF